MSITQSLVYFIPELILFAFGFIVIIFDLLNPNKKLIPFLSLFGLMISLWTLTLAPIPPSTFESGTLFSGMITSDGFALFFKLISILIVAVVILMSIEYKQQPQKYAGEYYALLLFITVGMMLLASSTNLLMIYMALEFVSLTSYILVGFLKKDIKSSEAALKYFLFGALCSGIMLYGMSLLYGLTSSLDLQQIAIELGSGGGYKPAVLLSIFFILAGFGFKVAMVPFQMWVPDVYEGAPTPITAFLSVGSKGLGFAVLLRVFITAFGSLQSDWIWLIGLLAVLTMSIGNIIAVMQENIKRLLAYSSIAQAGYILVGLAVATRLGQESVLIYLFVYFLMNLGAFTVVIFISNALDSDMLSAYQGLGQRAPFLAVSLALFLLSLTGIPPLAGFIGKFYVFSAAVQAKMFWLAVAIAVNSIVAAFYYFRIIRLMYLEDPVD
ncbi:MAG: NADH-quinone oxidoreductase subunit N, partial [bacterium]|nr:NADH-quinone oxidoreductase subunit N [bacterium]